MLGIKQDVLYKVLPLPPGLEVLSIQIGITRPITFCSVYFHPNSSISETKVLFRHMSDLCSGHSPAAQHRVTLISQILIGVYYLVIYRLLMHFVT